MFEPLVDFRIYNINADVHFILFLSFHFSENLKNNYSFST